MGLVSFRFLLCSVFASLWAASAMGAAPIIAHPYLLIDGAAPVYERASRTAPITKDLRPPQTIWGIPTKDGEWVQILGTEEGVNAQDAALFDCGESIIEVTEDGIAKTQHTEHTPPPDLTEIRQGKIVPAGVNYSHCLLAKGFLQASRIVETAALRQPRVPPIHVSGIGQPVPNLWRGIGIKDNRFWVTKADSHPYNAFVSVRRYRTETQYKGCGGFFITKDLIATADHCARDPEATALRIVVRRSKELLDQVDVDVVARDEDGDWALLKLRRPTTIDVEPLAIAQSLPSDTATFAGLTLGYPADLNLLSASLFGAYLPVATPCVFRISVSRRGELDSEPNLAQCTMWPGNSGGPLLIWNTDRNRFEVIGIASGATITSAAGSMSRDVFAKYEALLRSASQDVVREVEKYPNLSLPMSGPDPDIRSEGFPGIAAVLDLLGNGIANQYFISQGFGRYVLDGAFLRELANIPEFKDVVSLQGILATNRYVKAQTTRTPAQQKTLAALSNVIQICARECPTRAELFDPKFQFDGTVGDSVSEKKINDYTTSPIVAVYQSEPANLLMIITGGDVVGIDKSSMTVTAIYRKALFSGPNEVSKTRLEFTYYEQPETWGSNKYVRPSWAGKYVVNPPTDTQSLARKEWTPFGIPGGQMVRSWPLFKKLFRSEITAPLVVAVTTANYGIPGAVAIPFAGMPGFFDDDKSTHLGELLSRITKGNKQTPIVFYCDGEQSWRSYNAALRAIHLGYTHVMWYRWGLEGWVSNHFPLAPVAQLQ